MKIYIKTLLLGYILATSYNLQALETCPSNHQACFKGPTNQEYEKGAASLKQLIQFDYDTDGCLPSSGIHKDKNGNWIRNKGISAADLKPSKDCVFPGQIDPVQKIASTIYRKACTEVKGTKYCANMFAIYMVKDVGAFGHANDWEQGILWTTKNKITHVSYSKHKDVITDTFGSGKPFYKDANTARLVYHKDGGGTHALRFSKKDEKPENPLKQWITPYPIDWDIIVKEASNPKATEAIQIKNAFEYGDYGSASFPIKDSNFFKKLKAGKPSGYPDITK